MRSPPQSPFTIFWRFLSLGLISFGGPIAHIGYFQKTFVEKLHWLDQATFMHITAGCQLLPGPASSQLGFAIGLRSGGLAGAVAAFLGFTLPSFLIMTVVAVYAPVTTTWMQAVIAGLKLAAAVVVADACLTMFINFCNTPIRKGIAALATLAMLIVPAPGMQMFILLLAAFAGELPNRAQLKLGLQTQSYRNHRAVIAAILFGALFLASLWLVDASNPWLRLWSGFYQSGSLVFGGGHVVLPLLQQQVGELVGNDTFLLGYASAQAVPGPLFTLASFLGAEISTQAPWLGALTATMAVFLPGFLLVLVFAKTWEATAVNAVWAGIFARVNAAVVGLLLAAFFQPVLVSAVTGALDTVIAVGGLIALRVAKVGVLWLLLAMVVIASGRYFLQ